MVTQECVDLILEWLTATYMYHCITILCYSVGITLLCYFVVPTLHHRHVEYAQRATTDTVILKTYS